MSGDDPAVVASQGTSNTLDVDPAVSAAISDPGERGRERHLAGDRLVIGVSNVVAWLFPILMLAIVAQVLARKTGFNQAWLDDAQWWLYGFASLCGFCYAITTNGHVRVDVFHQGFSPRRKAWIEVFALGWLLLPFIGLMVDVMSHYAWASVVAREGSDSPNGLHRLYLLKSTLPLLFALAGVAALSALIRELSVVTRVALWKILLAAAPFSLFVADRLASYSLQVWLVLTRPELEYRRVLKEPLLEHSTTIGIGLLVVTAAVSLFGGRAGEQR